MGVGYIGTHERVVAALHLDESVVLGGIAIHDDAVAEQSWSKPDTCSSISTSKCSVIFDRAGGTRDFWGAVFELVVEVPVVDQPVGELGASRSSKQQDASN